MNFNHYFTNDELAGVLARWVDEYPALTALSSLGHSYEGQEIPLLTLTNSATGPDTDKPAIWIDANIHATELAGTTTALHIAHTLLTGYGTDARATRLLDNCAVYLAPRLNPDGAALALADVPQFVRSGTRPYPYDEKDDGIHAEDMDGDGRVLQMRIPDPNGDWKVSSLDPKLMEKRGPDEQVGDFYRLFQEGRIENFDGVQIRPARPVQGLDFNRNFPFEWKPENEQAGAGPFPTSEVEIRAARPVRVELALPEGAALVTGKWRTELGHLQGRSNKLDVLALYGSSPTDNRAWAEWVVQGNAGDEFGVAILSDRAGNIRTSVVLGRGE